MTYLAGVVCRARAAPRTTVFGGTLINSPPITWQRLKQQHRLEGGANFLHISEINSNRIVLGNFSGRPQVSKLLSVMLHTVFNDIMRKFDFSGHVDQLDF